jgi:hypothetical protein
MPPCARKVGLREIASDFVDEAPAGARRARQEGRRHPCGGYTNVLTGRTSTQGIERLLRAAARVDAGAGTLLLQSGRQSQKCRACLAEGPARPGTARLTTVPAER